MDDQHKDPKQHARSGVADGTSRAQPDFSDDFYRHGEREAPLYRGEAVRLLSGLVQANAGRLRLAAEVPEGPQRGDPGGRNRSSAADAHVGAAAGAVDGVVRGFQRARPGVPEPDEGLPGLVAAVICKILW